jgi:2'-5' RNA ligase
MRLFVAVCPPPTALADLDSAVSAARLLAGGPRWADPATWHLTLAFLGEVPESSLDRLAARLPAVRCSPISVRIAGVGTFPPRGAPQVLWAGVSGDVERLGQLARAVGRAAREARVATDRRPFRAHLTLGRWRSGDAFSREVVDSLSSYAGPPFSVSEAVLFRSHLGPKVRHEPLLTWSWEAPRDIPGRLPR